MRILQLVKTSVGAAWALKQVAELVQNGIEVHVAVPGGGPRVQQYEEAGCQVHLLQTDLPLKTPWRWGSLKREFRQLVKSVSPDLIHSHFVGTTLTMRLALGHRYDIPRVFQVPGPLHLESVVFSRGELACANELDHWIASCAWTKRRYLELGVPEDRVMLALYGTDVSTYSPQDEGILRRELGLGAEVPIIGMVAYMYAPKRYLFQKRGLKGHEDLIDALAIARQSCPEIMGVFVGGAWNGAAWYQSSVKRHSEKLLGDHGVFLGTRNDVHAIYPDMDIVVHPSHSENLGGAAESLLMAVPTIATDVGGFPDIVKPGETGWLVPPRNPGRLAATILEVMDNKEAATQMAVKGRALAKNELDVKKTTRDLLTAYRHILASKK